MAYQDPYAGQYGQRQQSYDSEFNPYAPQQHAHPSYGQNDGYDAYGGGYRDEPTPSQSSHSHPDVRRQATMRSFLTGDSEHTRPSHKDVPPLPLSTIKESDSASGFDHGEFSAAPKEKDFAFGTYRAPPGNLWTQGGRGRCIGRFCCCTLMIALFLVASIILTLLLWIRPPAVTIADAGPSALTGSTVQVQEDGITVNLGVNITVDNPNYFSIDFQQIKAEIFYPINNTAIGGGDSKNIVIKSNQQTNFTFPFAINYKTSLDPRNLILVDLATKCGVLGAKSDITVDYKITLGIRILMATISPVVSNSFTFACPLDGSDLEGLLKGVGLGGGAGGS